MEELEKHEGGDWFNGDRELDMKFDRFMSIIASLPINKQIKYFKGAIRYLLNNLNKLARSDEDRKHDFIEDRICSMRDKVKQLDSPDKVQQLDPPNKLLCFGKDRKYGFIEGSMRDKVKQLDSPKAEELQKPEISNLRATYVSVMHDILFGTD